MAQHLAPNSYGDLHGPDCYCLNCSWLAHLELASQAGAARKPESDLEMEDNLVRNNKEISIKKVIGRGPLPPFLGIMHRHFEKAKPAIASSTDAIINAPTDMLDMILPDDLIKDIESVEIVYHRNASA